MLLAALRLSPAVSRPASRFTEHDLRKVMKVAREAGEDLAVEILPDGTIRIRKVPSDSRGENKDEIDDGKRWVF